MITLTCRCGCVAVRRSIFFNFFEGGMRIINTWRCDDCFEDSGMLCRDHGPISITNHPVLLAGTEADPHGRIVALRFCKGCVRKHVLSMDHVLAKQYVRVIHSRCSDQAKNSMLHLSRVHMRDRLNYKQPILTACSFLAHTAATTTDEIVHKLAVYT